MLCDDSKKYAVKTVRGEVPLCTCAEKTGEAHPKSEGYIKSLAKEWKVANLLLQSHAAHL